MSQKTIKTEQGKQISLSDLLCCPFCGNKIKLIEKDHYCYDFGCGTVDCYLEFGADWHIDRTEISKLISMWQQRAT